MQSLITWEQLLVYLVIFFILYYGTLLFFFYRHAFFISRSFVKPTSSKESILSSAPATKEPEPDRDIYNQVHELMEECKTVFHAAHRQQLEKEQVMEALQVRIQKYPQLKSTAFQTALSNHIEQELNQRLSMELTEEEINRLWN